MIEDLQQLSRDLSYIGIHQNSSNGILSICSYCYVLLGKKALMTCTGNLQKLYEKYVLLLLKLMSNCKWCIFYYEIPHHFLLVPKLRFPTGNRLGNIQEFLSLYLTMCKFTFNSVTDSIKQRQLYRKMVLCRLNEMCSLNKSIKFLNNLFLL